MCGIFCYIGKEDPVQNCLKGLKQLEYRGYDSAGIAGINHGKIFIQKEVGNIDVLQKLVEKDKNLKNCSLAIGHTRWATHGEPTTINAHPHQDTKKTLALVHNGTIENFSELKSMLEKKNIKFLSETDTEIVAQLIASHYENNLLDAVAKTLPMLKGTYALALIHQNHPDQIIIATKENPLVIGYDDEKTEVLVSSDPNAFLGRNLNLIFLKNDEIAKITVKKVEVFTNQLEPVSKKTEPFEGKNLAPSKEGYDHYMLKEIFEQPHTIQKAFEGHISEEFGTADFPELFFTPQELLKTRHILIIACGTSWHAGCIAATLLQEKARIPTQAEIASELRFKNPLISEDTLVIAISQSGETADTLAAVREAKAKGAKILGICNVKNSTLTREADSTIFLNAGPEMSVCSTKAFTSQLTILSLFSLYMARLRHMSKEEGQLFLQEIKKMPEIVERVLSENSLQIQELAEKYAKYDSFFFVGRSYMYATSLEAALKLKEISYINASGYPAGELKHGPIALLSSTFPVVAFVLNQASYSKMLSSLMEIKARKAPILVFAFKNCKEVEKIADDVVWIPSTLDELATFPASVAGQLFAYYMAKKRNIKEIDRPRNLAKSVTVE